MENNEQDIEALLIDLSEVPLDVILVQQNSALAQAVQRVMATSKESERSVVAGFSNFV